MFMLCCGIKFCHKRATLDTEAINAPKTDGPKFVDPSMAAVSPYFKESMFAAHIL